MSAAAQQVGVSFQWTGDYSVHDWNLSHLAISWAKSHEQVQVIALINKELPSASTQRLQPEITNLRDQSKKAYKKISMSPEDAKTIKIIAHLICVDERDGPHRTEIEVIKEEEVAVIVGEMPPVKAHCDLVLTVANDHGVPKATFEVTEPRLETDEKDGKEGSPLLRSNLVAIAAAEADQADIYYKKAVQSGDKEAIALARADLKKAQAKLAEYQPNRCIIC